MILEPKTSTLLKSAKDRMFNDPDVREIVESKDEVYGRFSKEFTSDAVATLPQDEMRAFLDFKVNKHWSNLHRASGPIFDNFEETKRKLAQLLDPEKSAATRLDAIEDLKGMGHGIASAILHVSSPETFGVWNSTSESALKKLGLFPVFPRGASRGERYGQINNALAALATELQIDLWVLDALFWYLGQKQILVDEPEEVNNKPQFDGREKSIKNIVHTVNDTVKRANGQTVERKLKVKELKMSTYQLERVVRGLLDEKGECCAITGLRFEYEGEGDNIAMRPSLDRIDSDGHYAADNVQLVCRFINFWKMATDDGEFRELLRACVEKAKLSK